MWYSAAYGSGRVIVFSAELNICFDILFIHQMIIIADSQINRQKLMVVLKIATSGSISSYKGIVLTPP